MTSSQRNRLLDLVTKEVKLVDPNYQYTLYLIPYHLSQLPPEPLEDIFDKEQLKALNRELKRGKAMRAMLVQRGLLDE